MSAPSSTVVVTLLDASARASPVRKERNPPPSVDASTATFVPESALITMKSARSVAPLIVVSTSGVWVAFEVESPRSKRPPPPAVAVADTRPSSFATRPAGPPTPTSTCGVPEPCEVRSTISRCVPLGPPTTAMPSSTSVCGPFGTGPKTDTGLSLRSSSRNVVAPRTSTKYMLPSVRPPIAKRSVRRTVCVVFCAFAEKSGASSITSIGIGVSSSVSGVPCVSVQFAGSATPPTAWQ